MNKLEIQVKTLGYLSEAFSNGLTDKDWDIAELSENPSLPLELFESHPDRNWNIQKLSKRTYLPPLKMMKSDLIELLPSEVPENV